MEKITDYKLRQSADQKSFYALILQGGVEIVKSANGNMYATIKKVSMPTTFDELTCKSLIGSELPGHIQKVECDPYDYTLEETGEVITLNYRYVYVEEEQPVEQTFTKFYNASSNGVKA